MTSQSETSLRSGRRLVILVTLPRELHENYIYLLERKESEQVTFYMLR